MLLRTDTALKPKEQQAHAHITFPEKLRKCSTTPHGSSCISIQSRRFFTFEKTPIKAFWSTNIIEQIKPPRPYFQLCISISFQDLLKCFFYAIVVMLTDFSWPKSWRQGFLIHAWCHPKHCFYKSLVLVCFNSMKRTFPLFHFTGYPIKCLHRLSDHKSSSFYLLSRCINFVQGRAWSLSFIFL